MGGGKRRGGKIEGGGEAATVAPRLHRRDATVFETSPVIEYRLGERSCHRAEGANIATWVTICAPCEPATEPATEPSTMKYCPIAMCWKATAKSHVSASHTWAHHLLTLREGGAVERDAKKLPIRLTINKIQNGSNSMNDRHLEQNRV